jgi:MerR family transcriptional regulator, light-induced transcriptional regulator
MTDDSLNSGQTSEPGLTMGEMSARSGVSEATLRMWEVRHGFPQPRRMASGHRRYSESDVARVRAVVRGRESGLSLQAAIELALDTDDELPPSVYAALRSRFTHLDSQLLSKPAMLCLSRAIEDESLARAERPLLFGCFQDHKSSALLTHSSRPSTTSSGRPCSIPSMTKNNDNAGRTFLPGWFLVAASV